MKRSIRVATAAAAMTICATFGAAHTATASPVGVSSYESSYTDSAFMTERGFAWFDVHRSLDGTIIVSGEKLYGEAVSVSINVSLDGGEFDLAQIQCGESAVRVDPDIDTWLPGYSKLTLRNGDNARFVLQYTPPEWATDVAYNVTVSGAEQEEGNWLVSLHEPTVSLETL